MQIFSYEKHGFMIFKCRDIIHLNSDISDLEAMAKNAAHAGYHYIAFSFPAESNLSTFSLSTIVKSALYLDEIGGKLVIISKNEQIKDLLGDLDLLSLSGIASTDEQLVDMKCQFSQQNKPRNI